MEASVETLLKFYGLPGLIIAVLILLIWKGLLPKLDKRDEEYKAALRSIAEDARRERDLERQSREQERLAREREVDKFLESLRFRDEKFKDVADAIAERRHPRQR